ncbi:MAG: acetylornithine transaminase [Actinobacteria bacterium]|nr:MAG: acetylornithine transaminase [Actinomycetota bacterium]
MNLEQIRALDSRYHMNVYGRLPVAFVRGEGALLWDTEGKQYLDFLAGIAVMSVGHSHPKVVEAIREQAGTLTHVSNLFYTEPQAILAERLHDLLGWGKVFFSNSGAEANECALKLARRWARARGAADRSGVVVALGSFHGRTFTTLAATGQPHKHEPFAPLPAWFTYVSLNDEEALDQAVGDDTTAVMLEVVQGEGGVRLATPEYLQAARKFCEERSAALIFDEVQTGLGRTGKWFAFQHYDIAPDIVTLAKALGGGLPIGACIAREDVADAFKPGDHATTFGGGPVPCAAANAVLDVIESEGLVARAAEAGEKLIGRLSAATEGNGAVREIRGLGLLIAIELGGDWAAEIVVKALAKGLVVNNVAPNAVRLAPPLIVSDDQIEQAVEILTGILSEYGDAS